MVANLKKALQNCGQFEKSRQDCIQLEKKHHNNVKTWKKRYRSENRFSKQKFIRDKRILIRKAKRYNFYVQNNDLCPEYRYSLLSLKNPTCLAKLSIAFISCFIFSGLLTLFENLKFFIDCKKCSCKIVNLTFSLPILDKSWKPGKAKF